VQSSGDVNSQRISGSPNENGRCDHDGDECDPDVETGAVVWPRIGVQSGCSALRVNVVREYPDGGHQCDEKHGPLGVEAGVTEEVPRAQKRADHGDRG